MTRPSGMSTAALEREVARIRLERIAGDFDTDRAIRLADLCAEIRDRRRANGHSLIEIVRAAAHRFDGRPEYRASIEARAELREHRRARPLMLADAEPTAVRHSE